MKLKYYLRGLGIGILMTAIVMSVAASGEAEALSDDEIRERAIALGMTDNVVLSALQGEEETDGSALQSAAPDASLLPSAEPQGTAPSAVPTASEISDVASEVSDVASEISDAVSEISDAASAPSATPTASPAPSASAVPSPQPSARPSTAGMGLPAEDSSEITIIINSGEGSYTVCLRLEQAGLISSATDYDIYLNQNGYDKKLRVGSHLIPLGADHKTIADILTGNY